MNFHLKEPNSNKDTRIYLIYTLPNSGNKKLWYSVGMKIHPDEWDFSKNQPKKKKGRGGIKNQLITTKLISLQKHLDDFIQNKEFKSLPIVKKELKDYLDLKFKNISPKNIEGVQENDSIVEVIKLFIDLKNKSKGQSKSWNHKYKNLMNKILLFDLYNGHQTKFNDINQDWITVYCGFLRSFPELLKNNLEFNKRVLNFVETHNVRMPKTAYNDNTLSRHLNFFKTFMIWAKGKYHDLDEKQFVNPIEEFQPEDIHLSDEEIVMIENLELKNDSLSRIRDLFLIGIYSGQRYSDYSNFKKIDLVKTKHGDLIIKKAEKQEDEVYIPLHPKLMKIIAKYDWNLKTISSQKFNTRIKLICKEAGINTKTKKTNYIGNKKVEVVYEKWELVSSHTARRTFITLSSEKGMPDHIIMKITGIKKVETLKKYKKTSQQSVIDIMNKIWY